MGRNEGVKIGSLVVDHLSYAQECRPATFPARLAKPGAAESILARDFTLSE